MIEFTIVGEIQTKQRPRATTIGGYARVYTPKDTILYENYVRAEYQRQCKDFSFQDKPLVINIECVFKANKDIQKFLDLGYNIACVNAKDCDNLAKIICDSLNGIAYNDDRQIVMLKVSKYYGESEYVKVKIANYTGMLLKTAKEQYKRNDLLYHYELLENRLKQKGKLNKQERQRLDRIKGELFGKDNDK